MAAQQKFDLHCHTKEGSPDGKVSIFEYAAILKKKGFDGMLVTDHDSYGAYYEYIQNPNKQTKDFYVFRGIEYDTIDHGHFLVILPEQIRLKLLESRGLRLKSLIKITHFFGGIIGPAHPYGAKFLSLMRGSESKYQKYLLECDFLEAFNSSEYFCDNNCALKLAKKWNFPCTGGSDSHKTNTIGEGYSLIDGKVTSTNELIEAIVEKKIVKVGGSQRYKKKHPILTNAFPLGFLFHFYNILMTVLATPVRCIRKISVNGYMKTHKPYEPLFWVNRKHERYSENKKYG